MAYRRLGMRLAVANVPQGVDGMCRNQTSLAGMSMRMGATDTVPFGSHATMRRYRIVGVMFAILAACLGSSETWAADATLNSGEYRLDADIHGIGAVYDDPGAGIILCRTGA